MAYAYPIERAAMACELTRWSGEPGVCRWCSSALSGRRTAWCSFGCEQTFRENHDWSVARVAALKRDNYACVRCGRIGWNDLPHGLLGGTLMKRRDTRWVPPMLHIDAWRKAEAPAFAVALQREHAWWILGVTHEPNNASHDLEVNHKTPVRGKRLYGCQHHLEGIETLCRRCHYAETAAQRRRGELGEAA